MMKTNPCHSCKQQCLLWGLSVFVRVLLASAELPGTTLTAGSSSVFVTPLGNVEDTLNNPPSKVCNDENSTNVLTHFSKNFCDNSELGDSTLVDVDLREQEEGSHPSKTEANRLYERGLAFVGHLSKVLKSSKEVQSFKDDKKKSKTFAATTKKWHSIHDKAEGSLRKALALFSHVEESAVDTAKLSEIRLLLNRLTDKDLALPSSNEMTLKETATTTTVNPEDLKNAKTTMQKGLQFVKHLKSLVEASDHQKNINEGDKQKRRAAAIFLNKRRSLYERAVQSLEEASQLFQKVCDSNSSDGQMQEYQEEIQNNLNALRRDDFLGKSSHQ